jgi:hypothetical protein
VKVLLIVDYATHGGNAGFGSHAGGEAPCGDWEGWKAAWLGRLWNVAARFGDRVDAWEIWNEPDQPLLACGEDGYNPGMPSDYYGILLRDAYLAIRDAGAQGPVITGGLDSGNVLYIVDAGTAAGGIWADGVSIHPYGVVPDPSWCPDPGEDLNCDWGTLGGKVDEYSGWTGLPVWITEWGVKTTDTVHAARYLTSGYAAFASRGDRVAHAFFFCESDAMVFPFGLTFDDGSPKPDVFDAFAGLAHGARDLDDRTGSLHGTVETDGSGTPGIWVSAWGHLNGDFHIVQTDGLGIYAFTDLDPSQLYNVVVNAELDPSAPGGFAVRDDGHAFEVRNDVTLISGPDGWHGEDFQLPF